MLGTSSPQHALAALQRAISDAKLEPYGASVSLQRSDQSENTWTYIKIYVVNVEIICKYVCVLEENARVVVGNGTCSGLVRRRRKKGREVEVMMGTTTTTTTIAPFFFFFLRPKKAQENENLFPFPF